MSLAPSVQEIFTFDFKAVCVLQHHTDNHFHQYSFCLPNIVLPQEMSNVVHNIAQMFSKSFCSYSKKCVTFTGNNGVHHFFGSVEEVDIYNYK